MSFLDKAKAEAERIGHRVEETLTGAHNNAKSAGFSASEAAHDAGRHIQEAATTTSHVGSEQGQRVGHAGESIGEKVAHGLGLNAHHRS